MCTTTPHALQYIRVKLPPGLNGAESYLETKDCVFPSDRLLSPRSDLD